MRKLSSALASRVGGFVTLLLFAASLCVLPEAAAISFTPAPSPNLRLADLGRVSFAGNFDAISLFKWNEQLRARTNPKGTHSLYTRLPDGAFTPLHDSDGSVKAMCPFVSNGALQGVVVGGNFTSFDGVEVQGIALYKPNTSEVIPWPGLSGSVNALYCDSASGTVYVGGSFSGGNSTNAIAWSSGWRDLPFAGFNGPVTSITKSNGNIVFGGSFDGLGNATSPMQRDSQAIPLSSAIVSSGNPTLQNGFSNPRNIVCKTGQQDGPGNTWLLSDNQPGWWQAKLNFGFRPSKVRLYNTQLQGRGTTTWRFTAMPINGIMNLTYIDPTSGQQAFCDARCPLPQGNISAQDFHFVDSVGMDSFRIDISAWQGSGGGLSGIELFQNETYVFAINDFNGPTCDPSLGLNAATTTGSAWKVTPSGSSTSDYLTAKLDGQNIQPETAQVVFKPNIAQSGNYSVTVYTPGCIQDGTCETRGRVNITGDMGTTNTGSSIQPIATELYQTNNFDKYDQVYLGYIDVSGGSFQPSVTLSPSAGQVGPLTVVAQRVRFELLSPSSGGINGLFEYNPNEATVDSDLSKSTVNRAGKQLSPKAYVKALVTDQDTTYVAGNFSTNNFTNIFSINGSGPQALSNGGLNSGVRTVHLSGGILYVGGNFTNTRDNTNDSLRGVAAYSIQDSAWRALGAGVDGVVSHIVPFSVNLTENNPETVISVTGVFGRVLGFGNNRSFPAQGLAVWVPSRQNWLENLDVGTISLQGTLTTYTEVPGDTPLFAGDVSSLALGASGAVGLSQDDNLSLQQYPFDIPQQQQVAIQSRKRAVGANGENVTGIVTGKIYRENGLDITILGGHFSATSSGGNASNLLFINNTDSVTRVNGLTTELDSDSAFLALGTQGTTLFAGGAVSGQVNGNNVNGLILYDLSRNVLSGTQPPPLAGADVVVNTIAPQPTGIDIYVGGRFESAGSLSCPGLCVYNAGSNQWTAPGTGLSGVVSTMIWASNTQLMLGGNLTVGGNRTTLVTYDAKSKVFAEFNGAGSLPGPITALCPDNQEASQHWVAGKDAQGGPFLEKYDGSQWRPIQTNFGPGSTILGLQTFSLSRDHGRDDFLENDRALLVLGQLSLPNYGNSSAALFNGTAFTPFIISTADGNSAGSLSQAFVEKPENFFTKKSNNLAVGFVVLIGLGVALGLTFLIVVAGIIAERVRRRQEGYIPANTQMLDQHSNIDRIPPEHLFSSLGPGQNRGGPL